MPTSQVYRPDGKCVPTTSGHPMGKRAAAREWRKREAAIRKHDRGACACRKGR